MDLATPRSRFVPVRFNFFDQALKIVVEVRDRMLLDQPGSLTESFPVWLAGNRFPAFLNECIGCTFERGLKGNVLDRGVRSRRQVWIDSHDLLFGKKLGDMHRLHRQPGAADSAGDLHQTARITRHDSVNAGALDPLDLLIENRNRNLRVLH